MIKTKYNKNKPGKIDHNYTLYCMHNEDISILDLLKHCKSLNDEAERAISDAKQALWGAENKDKQ